MQELNEEEQRHAKEHMSEEELAVFDLLVKPGAKLKKEERELVKEVARYPIQKPKDSKLVLDWKKTQQTRSGVIVTIEKELDRLPEVYGVNLYR